MTHHRPQWLAIVLRYAHLCALVVIGTLLALFGYPILDALGSIVYFYAGKFQSWMIYTFCLALSAGMWLALYELGGWHPRHLLRRQGIKFTAQYPPTWLAGFVAAALYLLLRTLSTGDATGNSQASGAIAGISFMMAGVLLVVACLWVHHALRGGHFQVLP